MTPMIDVVFLLIIFFLVSSHLAKQENAVRLDLPEAVSGLKEDSERETLVVNVLPDGSWRSGGVVVEENALAMRLQQGFERLPQGLRLKIRTDEVVPYGRLEPILRIASQVGVSDIVFSVYEERAR